MDTAEIRRRFLAHFEGARHTVVPSASLLRTTRRCCSSTPAWCRSSPTSSARRPRPTRGRPACRSACAPSTSRTSARPPGTAPSSRCAATSPSATTSRRVPSSSPGSWSPARRTRAAWGSRSDWVPVLDGDDEAVDLWSRSPASRRSGSSGAAARRTTGPWASRARRPLLGDPLRPRPGARRRRRPRRRRGPLPGDLEPRLHAGRARGGALQGRLRHRRAAAAEEHRHRHGPGAGRLPAAGQAEHVRDRRDVPGDRAAPRSSPDAGTGRRGAEPRGRRPLPGRRRPRPHPR